MPQETPPQAPPQVPPQAPAAGAPQPPPVNFGSPDIFISEAKNFIKNPLGIIGLFIVLVYASAAIVTGTTAKGALDAGLPMTWFLVVFPFFILGVFTFLVIKHHLKLYGPSDFIDQSLWLKIQDIIYDLDKEHHPINASLRATGAIDPSQQKLDEAKSIINAALRERLKRASNNT